MIGPSLLLLFVENAPQQQGGSAEHTVAIFIIQITLMLFLGRLLGEVMQRFGQPAVMGQLIAGVILGPSIFGAISPSTYQNVFPDIAVQKKMIDAISQLGILMLLLLTGMETDLKLVNKMKRTAFFTSVSGIIFPFACGYILGEYLPDSMIPDPSRRIVTSLFLATALSISSVKIVAMVIMEVGFLRRNVGQIILASAILDDTIGWIIIAIIGGLAAGGTLSFSTAGLAFLGTIGFLAFSFTIGRKMVAYAIRWSNDHLIIEMPVITTILIITFVAALFTDFIGVHTVLGAFVVGILIGQSPILTKHIEEQLRGLIVALFAPIFFAVAGREIDLGLLNNFGQIQLAIGFILIASVGKISGAFIGGLLGRMGTRASIALAIGMNARGSTEVIVATIGLSLGVLNRDLFTMIVVMAIVTTLVTPPLLRWALTRIPPTGEEKERLEREEAQAKQFVPNIERMLIAADKSGNGQLASVLSGLFAGTQKLTTTVLEFGTKNVVEDIHETKSPGDVVKSSAEIGAGTNEENIHKTGVDEQPTVVVNEEKESDFSKAVLGELEKGYDLIFLGIDGSLVSDNEKRAKSSDPIATILGEYAGVSAIAIARGKAAIDDLTRSINILVPITGTDYSQRAAEIALALAKAGGGKVTALHVAPPAKGVDVLRRPEEMVTAGRTLIRAFQKRGNDDGVKVRGLLKVQNSPETSMLQQIKKGKHNLLVVGVKSRGSEELVFFGHRIAVLLENSPCPILLVNS